MTNEDLIRLDQRAVNLEIVVVNLQQRVIALENSLAASNAKVDTLNTFYGTALSETMNRVLGILDKAAGGTTPTP